MRGVRHAGLPQEFRQRLHHQPVGLLAADRHAQARSAACRRRPGAGSARAWSGTHWRPRRCGPCCSGKWISTKLATLGVTLRPSLPISSVSQASQRVLCSRERSWCAVSSIAAMPAAIAGSVDVERPADAVDRIDHVRRPVHPAEPQRGEPVDLRERAAHHDVLAGRDQLDAGLVVVAPRRIPHRPRRSRAAHAAAGPCAGA